MDDRRRITGTQFVEKNKVFCETVLSDLSQKRNLLDQPLNIFTEENVCEATQLLRTTLQTLYSLPTEIMQEHIPSYDAIIRGLQNTIVELTFALDQLSPPIDKASFYKHLLVAQQLFAEVFAHNLPVASEHVDTDPAPANIIHISSRPKALQDFSSTILPDIYNFLQNPGSRRSTQYEQAIKNLQILEELLEKQRKMLKASSHLYDDENESDILRCRLNAFLSYASELLRRLIHSLSTLQTLSRSKSRRTAQLREETLHALTLFIHYFNDILQKTQELNLLQHQERFQRRNTDAPNAKKIITLARDFAEQSNA